MANKMMQYRCLASRTFSQRLLLKNIIQRSLSTSQERICLPQYWVRSIKLPTQWPNSIVSGSSLVRNQTLHHSRGVSYYQKRPHSALSSEIITGPLLDRALQGRTPIDLNGEEVYLTIKDLENTFYDSLSDLPWLQKNRRVAFIQLLLSDYLISFPEPIWSDSSMSSLIARLMELAPSLDNRQLTETFLSLIHLGVMYSPYMEPTVPELLMLCRERMSSLNLEALSLVSGIQSRMFQRDWVGMQKAMNRFPELLAEPNIVWTPEEAVHVANIVVNLFALPLANPKEHVQEPMRRLLDVLQDERYLTDPDSICLYLRLAKKLFLKSTMDHTQSRKLISLASAACLKHMDKFQPENIAESCAALRQSRCFTHDLIHAFRSRSLELLDTNCKLSDVSNLFYSINQHAPLDMKRRYESAIFQRLDGEVDCVILSNIAENLATVNVKNNDLMLLFQEHLAKQADKLAMYTTRFNKIVRLLIRKPFILPEHDAKFKESVLRALDKELKVSSLALFTLYLLPSSTTALSEDFMERILTSIPKLRSYDHHRIAMGINQMRMPITSQLRKQIATIQSALSEQIIRKSDEISNLDYLYQITMEIVVNNRKRDPTLTTHFMEMFPRFTKSINDVGLTKVLHIFHEMAYYLPEVYDDLVEFALNSFETIQMEKLVFLVSALARVGYIPKRFEEFSALMLQSYEQMGKQGDKRHQLLLMRNFNILQLYPERELLDIFSIDYIEGLDGLIEQRPLQKIMYEQTMVSLNRNVILECPQLDIPWFHQQYLEDKLKTEESERPLLAYRFRDDVESVLTDPEILSHSKNLRRYVHSPYGYLINFECILNHKNEPVPPDDFKDVVLPVDWQRVAILTLTEKSYTCNSRRLLGFEQLRWRHLEIMGYKVVEVPYFEWYSMGLSDYHAKVDFLSAKIFNS